MNHNLVYYGNDILRRVAEEVRNINHEIISIIENMYKIMYKARGVGLAGPQIDVSKKIITIDVNDFNMPKLTLINPEIISRSEKVEPYDEGCLSIPGISETVIRPADITVKGITPDEKEVIISASGLLARALQHEIDHLNGIMFIDHLEDQVKKRLRSDLKKIKKLNKES